ncbi:MAG TPA: arginine--tRNA ligase, partial [Acidimicrobiales bacterium]|nr:arginine--tRNA ligase [Acidimicrobiales bacterium]
MFGPAQENPLIREQLAAAVRQALAEEGIPDAEVHLERPARLEHGDWSTNVALASAKRAGRNPRELASAIAARLEGEGVPHLEAVEIAGPGFINFRLAPGWLHEVLVDVVGRGTEGFG